MWFAPLVMLFTFLVYEKSSLFWIILETFTEMRILFHKQKATHKQAKNTQGLKSHKTRKIKTKTKSFSQIAKRNLNILL